MRGLPARTTTQESEKKAMGREKTSAQPPHATAGTAFGQPIKAVLHAPHRPGRDKQKYNPTYLFGTGLLVWVIGELSAQARRRFCWWPVLPRASCWVGAGPAMVGTVLQTMLRNPFADPFVLGTSYVAGVGAVTLSLGASTPRHWPASTPCPRARSPEAVAATAMVFAVARAHRGTGAARLLPAGVAVSFGQAVTYVLVMSVTTAAGRPRGRCCSG
ncbi:iron chelate uptake ABC transporter family permease subunit [Streptomyces sp. NPDC029041]|uniref:iron chelate uptake ABC transporter family permease subunit n=1 Tax=Streptomyces sp. NPDC029041 TaxID=3155727 RepID=UPI0033E0EFE9